MFCYPAYKAIKEVLKTVAPCFFYIGQYTKGGDNTSYRVPAIYIEMPKPGKLVTWGRKLKSLKPAAIRIHYISNAPFKNADGAIQDGLIASHENVLKQIDVLLNGSVLRAAPIDDETEGKLLTQKLLSTDINTLNFQNGAVFSIITYTTEIYSYHLQG